VHLEAIDRRLISAGYVVVAGLICLWFAISGIRNGVVYAPRSRSRTVPVERDQQPVDFWLNVCLYIVAGVGLLCWAWNIATDVTP
jgi:hypothetical protein